MLGYPRKAFGLSTESDKDTFNMCVTRQLNNITKLPESGDLYGNITEFGVVEGGGRINFHALITPKSVAIFIFTTGSSLLDQMLSKHYWQSIMWVIGICLNTCHHDSVCTSMYSQSAQHAVYVVLIDLINELCTSPTPCTCHTDQLYMCNQYLYIDSWPRTSPTLTLPIIINYTIICL